MPAVHSLGQLIIESSSGTVRNMAGREGGKEESKEESIV